LDGCCLFWSLTCQSLWLRFFDACYHFDACLCWTLLALFFLFLLDIVVLRFVVVNLFWLRLFFFFDGRCRFDAYLCQSFLASLCFLLFWCILSFLIFNLSIVLA
jgi:hypothetical protein